MMIIFSDTVHFSDDESLVIIKYPTGVHYQCQCGGMSCYQNTLEGFPIIIGGFDFDDCKYGCYNIKDNKEMQEKLANDLDVYFKNSMLSSMIQFDFQRISELMEGWWPVKFKLAIEDEGLGYRWMDAIIHNGNCD